jgi:hypothetical protein
MILLQEVESMSRLGPFVSIVLVTGFTGAAQSPDYHLEYTPTGDQSTRIVLVNDSPNTIEAFRMIQQCSLIQNHMSQDVLFTPVNLSSIRDAEGKTAQSTGPEHGGTWDVISFHNGEKPMNTGECAPRFELILFGDGSYQGKESAARAVKAQRDGILAGITQWEELLSHVADERDLSLLADVARQCQDNDLQKVHETFMLATRRQNDEAAELANEFWSGKMIADSNIAVRLHGSNNGATSAQVLSHTKDFV